MLYNRAKIVTLRVSSHVYEYTSVYKVSSYTHICINVLEIIKTVFCQKPREIPVAKEPIGKKVMSVMNWLPNVQHIRWNNSQNARVQFLRLFYADPHQKYTPNQKQLQIKISCFLSLFFLMFVSYLAVFNFIKYIHIYYMFKVHKCKMI